MKLLDVVNKLGLEEVVNATDDKTVEDVYIGDLLSIVMSKAKENDIWITIQTHANVIAVASLVGISAVIVVEGMKIDEETIVKAKDMDIPIYKTGKSAYEIACQINSFGI
ncbi:DRTGG domain-containing protein [Clostridiaceae bacterium M8S5]|nr:DRTGG domain-containing protein [Clostridiaceae bacterium M8S5]